MRQAINENPMVQMAVLGICAVVLAFVLFTSVLKKDDAAETPPATTSDPAIATADPAATATPPADAGNVTPPADTGTVTPPADAGGADGLLASKGLPKDVLVAYAKGNAIALVVVDPKQRGMKRIVKAVKGFDVKDVQVFVVKVNDIAKYSRITQGVSVSRTPALIVIQPRKLSEGAPMATVSYGFRSPRSARQAIEDAFYKGGNVPAYP